MRLILLASLSFILAAQPYAPLVRALKLTDAQVAGAALNSAQQLKLAEIAKVLVQFATAGGAAALGLIAVHDWPTGWPCPQRFDAIGSAARQFDLSVTQVAQLEKEQQAVRRPILEEQWPKQRRRRELLEGGANENSSEAVELASEISKLQTQYSDAGPSREFILSVLNGAQKEKAAAFERDLELAREALELHLIRVPGLPEVLCH
jgi:hypothetical protein